MQWVCVCVYMWERGLVCGNSDWNLVSMDRLYCCIQNPRDKIDSETTESTFEYRFNIVEVFFQRTIVCNYMILEVCWLVMC